MNFKNKVMGALNSWGPAMMIVIAIIPIGGLMMGIGVFMQNATFIEAAPWLASPVVYGFSSVLRSIGNIIIGNLPVLFCVAISEGLSDGDGKAGFAGFVGYMVFNTVMGSILGITAETVAENSSMYTNVLGVNTLQTGVLGGMAVAILTSVIYKRFKDIKLPEAISFFQGKRFVPIANTIANAVLAVPFVVIWPTIQRGIDALSYVFMESNNPFTLWLYGVITRLLIPFGLHNVWYPPFYFQFGSYTTLAGDVVHGDLNIFLAQLSDGVPITAGTIVGGCYLMPAFCIAAALAITKMAKPENRKKTLGLFMAGIITILFTGITEPIEFVFLFSCPLLYVIHALFLSLAWPILSIAGVRVGTTFCGGLMDLIVYGALQNSPKWWLIIPLNIVVGVIYYFIFKALIRIFDFKTPGREDETAEEGGKLVEAGELSAKILEALGGKDNIETLGACATRLRVTLKNKDINEDVFKNQLDAKGVMHIGDSLQIIYGPQAASLKEEIQALMEGRTVSKAAVKTNEEKPQTAGTSAGDITGEEVVSLAEGKLMDITQVPDETFAQKMLGDGYAVDPEDGLVVSPVSGTVESIFPTGHACCLVSDKGLEVLLHLGIDTVALNGEPFENYVKEGDRIEAGQKLIKMDVEAVRRADKSPVCICVFTNAEDRKVVLTKSGKVKAGEKDLLRFE